MKRRSAVTEVLAAAIIVTSLILASAWAIVTPIFQQQDESNHYDYVLTIASAGRPVHTSEGDQSNETHPVVRYLLDRTNGKALRTNVFGHVPDDYGTAQFYRALDAGAPRVDPAAFAPGKRIDPVPFYAPYPFGYYAAAAGITKLIDAVHPGSITSEFFAVRFFGVALFAVTLCFTWFSLRLLPMQPAARLIVLFLVGSLPMAAQFAAAVQPDDLIFALAAITFYCTLRLRKDGDGRMFIWLGLALGAVLMVKRHYWVALAAPAYAFVFALFWNRHRSRSETMRAGAWLIAPSLAAFAVTAPFLDGNHGPSGPICTLAFNHASPGEPLQFAAFVGQNAAKTLTDELVSGTGLGSFWLTFGGYGTPIDLIGGDDSTRLLALIVMQATVLLILALFLARRLDVLRRLIPVARKRSVAEAALLLTGNVSLNALLLFDLIIIAYRVASDSFYGLQGRYWLPFLMPLAVIAIDDGPRVLRRRTSRRALSTVISLLLFAFVTWAAGSAFPSIVHRYYAEKTVTRPSALVFGRPTSPIPQLITKGSGLVIEGWAIDMGSLTTLTAVSALVDAHETPGRYGLPSEEAVCRAQDRSVRDSGFEVSIPPSLLPEGRHTIGFVFGRRDDPRRVKSELSYTVEVRASTNGAP